ncbi:MAG: cytochrome c3 family protein [Deferribacteraceae bacterium]|jgi:hypothetical protein|nr:cytochrome c3 family protein [Deferribacteraceae bacterium]
MNKYKKIFLLIATLLATVVLISCSSDVSDNGGSNGSAVTLTPDNHIMGYGSADCAGCHPSASLSDMHATFVADAAIGCFCHGDNGVEGATGGGCTSCHTDADYMAGVYFGDGDFNDYLVESLKHGVANFEPAGTDPCQMCHGTPNHDGDFDYNTDLANLEGWKAGGIDKTYNFCVACHSGAYAGGLAGYMETTGDIHGGGVGTTTQLRAGNTTNSIVDCMKCHNPHTSTNEHLVVDEVLVDNANMQISYSATNTNELCAVCHTNPAGTDAKTGLKQAVHPTEECQGCHDRVSVTATTCYDCHADMGTTLRDKHVAFDVKSCNDCHFGMAASVVQSHDGYLDTNNYLTSGCAGCHPGQFDADKIAFHKNFSTAKCANCHENIVEKSFTAGASSMHVTSTLGDTPDCLGCHANNNRMTKNEGFTGTTYNHTTGAPLTTCSPCHNSAGSAPVAFTSDPLSADVMTSTIGKNRCNDCHKHGAGNSDTPVDFHHGTFSRRF